MVRNRTQPSLQEILFCSWPGIVVGMHVSVGDCNLRDPWERAPQKRRERPILCSKDHLVASQPAISEGGLQRDRERRGALTVVLAPKTSSCPGVGSSALSPCGPAPSAVADEQGGCMTFTSETFQLKGHVRCQTTGPQGV